MLPEVPEGALELKFSDDELSTFLGAPLTFEEADEDGETLPPEPSADLRRLSRQLVGQYADVLASFISRAFSQQSISEIAQQVTATLEPLLRLASGTGDTELGELLRDLQGLLQETPDDQALARTRYLKRLRAWVLRYADCLGGAVGERLSRIVDFGEEQPPLLQALEQIRGIGPRRLERLYCAGLFTVERLKDADPDEIAQVTGLPHHLAEAVVKQTQQFAEDERTRRAQELRRSVRAFKHALHALGAQEDPDMLAAAMETMTQLQQLIVQLKDD
ncbi:MAG: helix-hairpin-helix domain-containing protein [Myxococcota bacterium]